jgi:serine/threonine protein kinase
MGADVWRQAKGVLAEALMCPPGEREAWVAERCADPVLRREVQAYLHDYDEEFLETVLTVSDTFDHVTPSNGEPAPDIDPGVRIGRYVVLERLGVGGMGRVYLGDDTGLHRKVALKCLIASGSNDDLRAKILHEAQSAARINHPNIAVVHDVVEHEGRPFLVMEYVEGESLAALLRRERPPVEKILSMGRQLASALTAAHGKGIIHRDLKPANIQVMPDGSVKILDFGVAQAMSVAAIESGDQSTTAAASSGTSATLRSGRGVIMHPGTPAYMSPEQMFGKPIDQRSDIYSLGVVVYEMATGHRPYSTDSPLDVVLALSRSLLRPTGVEAQLSPEVSDVIGKMLAVKVEDRYQSAAEVEAAITALISPELVSVVVQPTTRSRAWLALKVVAFVAAVPLTVWGLGFLTSAWFNYVLDRHSPFSNDSPALWLELGFRSLFAPGIIIGGVLFALEALRFALRVLSLSKNVDSLLTASRTQARKLSTLLSFNNPAVIGQAVATVGLLALIVVFWRFQEFLRAVGTLFSRDPSQNFASLIAPLRPHHLEDAGLYRAVLQILMLFLSVSILRLTRIRARQSVRQGGGALAMVGSLLLLTLVAAELPYRLVWKNAFELIHVADDRCYAIGQADTQLLAFCPDVRPPRNRIVLRDDPAVRRSGVFESIFTPREESR